MPHISIEYTPNLAGAIDLDNLAKTLHDAAQRIGVFPRWGLRALAFPATAAYVADDIDNAYVQVRIKIAPGRSSEVRAEVSATLFEILQSALALVAAQRPLGYQLDVFEFVADVTHSGGSIPGSPTGPPAD